MGRIEPGIFLVEVAGLQQMFGEQLLDMGRALERRDELPQPRGNPGDENVGEAAAGFLRGVRRRDLGGERARHAAVR